MGNYAIEYYAEDAVFPAENQVLDGVDYGPTGADFTGTVLIGAGVGYPAVGNVRLSVVYGESNEFIGTLALPTVGQVESGVGYGASGTEFTGTLVVGGGGEAVNLLFDRSPGVTLKPFVGETVSQQIELYRADGVTPINLDGKTLVIVFETRQGVDVATVTNSSITVSGDANNIVTFPYPSAVTASQRVLTFAIRDASTPSTVYEHGIVMPIRTASVDAP
jgi:hypothetical protein